MANVSSSATPSNPSITDAPRVGCRDSPDRSQGDRSKWNKFSEQDLSALKNRDDLVSQVVAKYGIEKAQAQRDVDAMLKGRQV